MMTSHEHLRAAHAEAHPFCFVCSGSNPMGLAIQFSTGLDGSVAGRFLGNCALEGYRGRLHGGVIAALLDGAMTHCLFAHGVGALTVELRLRYRAAVTSAKSVSVRAWLEKEARGVYQLRAELEQGGEVKARATGKFLKQLE